MSSYKHEYVLDIYENVHNLQGWDINLIALYFPNLSFLTTYRQRQILFSAMKFLLPFLK
jgi:hypothetical protein